MPKELSLLDIFSDYRPRKMSNGQIRMMCPFTENHTDGSGKMSFFATPEKNAYHCFSCEAKGTLTRLLTKHFGVPLFEALDLVNPLFEKDTEKDKKSFDLDISWNLTPPSEFTSRGYSKDTLKYFRVGMTEDDRIVIPYYKDFKCPLDLVGYQIRDYRKGRTVRNNENFEKTSYLYNLDFSYDYTILVEGQSDCWRLFQHGYNATGLMGNSISDWQKEQLCKFKTVYLALDNDEPGRIGIERCYATLKNDTEILLIPYNTKDPGDCISPRIWSKHFHAATDYLTYSLEMSLNWDGYVDMRDKVLRSLRSK